MWIERMIELLKIEHECMLRASYNRCNRKCEECDLVQDDWDLHKMYTIVIRILENMIKEENMKIISHGKIKKQEEEYVVFKCSNCGCEFKAQKDEYHEDSLGCATSYPITHYIYANCPECHKMCGTTKKDEIKNHSVTLSGSNTRDYCVENPTGSDSNHATNTTMHKAPVTMHKTESSYCHAVECEN